MIGSCISDSNINKTQMIVGLLQLLTSFYGMIISYFTYSGVLESLFGADPLSDENLAARKQHLRRMLQIVLTNLEENAVEGGTR